MTNAAIGKDYKAYKILDATYNGDAVAYSTTSHDLFAASGSPWLVSDIADANGGYNVQIAENKTISDVTDWIESNLSSFTAINPSTGATGATATSNTVTWTGLAYGYYYVSSTLGSIVSVDTVKPSASILDKNPTEPSDPGKSSDTASGQIGDLVTFTVTYTATNYVTTITTDSSTGEVTATSTQVTLYTITDTADGFDYLVDSSHPVSVQVGTRAAFTVTPTVTQQTASASGTMVFTIPWADNSGNPLYNYSESVTVTYYGRINEFATDGNAENDVSIANNGGADPMTDSTETTTYNLTINKTDGTNPLPGASFELYRGAASTASPAGTIVTLVDITSTIASPATGTKYFRVAENGETGITTIELPKAAEGSSDPDYTCAIIYGLDGDDTYYVKETVAPDGYNKLDTEVEVVMNSQNQVITVANQAGTELPSTGGAGTTLFYVIGGILVVGALIVLIARRRVSE